MNRRHLTLVALLLTLLLWGGPTSAHRRISPNRQFYDSLFCAYHQRSRFGGNDSLLADIQLMLRMAKRDGNQNAQMLAMMDLAIQEGQRGNIDTMFAYMETVHQMEDRNTPFRVRAHQHYSDGIVYYISHQYARSIDALEEANRAFQSLNDSAMRAKTLVHISDIYSDQLMYIKAENLLSEALSLTNDDTRPMTLLHLAGLKMKMGDANEGRRLLDESSSLMEQEGYSPQAITPFTSNYWRYYYHLSYYCLRLFGQLDSARHQVDLLMDVVQRYGHLEEQANASLLYAELHRAEGNYVQAIAICQSLLANDSLTKDEIRLSAYRILAPSLAQQGRYKEAYEAELAINGLTEHSSLATSHDMISAEMFGHYDMRIRKMESAQRERSIRSTAIASTAIIMALVCLIVLLFRRVTIRKNRLESSLYSLPNMLSNTDASPGWVAFEEKLTKEDYLFVQRLTRRFRNLTGSEIKICILLRRNVSDEQSAQILNLNVNSMKVYRSRLRKKFNIASTAIDLDDFIAQV